MKDTTVRLKAVIKQGASFKLPLVRRYLPYGAEATPCGGVTEAIEYMAENPQATLHIAANAAERQVKKLRDRMDDLKEQNAPRESIKEVETQMTEVMQRFAALVQSKKKP